jgi:hypothetical protein
MWIGVFLTIVLELTPKKMHTTSIAIYLFIITNIGASCCVEHVGLFSLLQSCRYPR